MQKTLELSKLSDIVKHKQTEIKEKAYVNEQTATLGRVLFNTRTRMLPIESNQGNRDKVCEKCNSEKESQRHLIQECTKIKKEGAAGEIKLMDAFVGDRG